MGQRNVDVSDYSFRTRRNLPRPDSREYRGADQRWCCTRQNGDRRRDRIRHYCGSGLSPKVPESVTNARSVAQVGSPRHCEQPKGAWQSPNLRDARHGSGNRLSFELWRVAPQPFKVVKEAPVIVEHVNNHIAIIEKDPSAGSSPFNMPRSDTVLH